MKKNSIFFLTAFVPALVSAQMISSDSERILASEKIPFATIQAKNWTTKFPKIINASSDSKKQITTLHFKLDHGKVIRDNFPYVYGENPAISIVKLDLNLPPEKYVQYNQLSC